MKNRVSVLCSVLLGASLAASAQSAAPTKVGIINIQQAIVSTSDGQKAIKELEAKFAPKKKDLEKLQGEIAGLQDQLNKMSSVGSDEQKRKLMADIDQRRKTFNRDVEDAQAESDQEQGRVLNDLGGRMLAVLDKYGRDNGFAVILDVSSQQTPVLFAANAVDVTREVVELYNKNAPAAAPAGAKPTAAPAGGPAGTGAAPGAGAPAGTKPAAPPAASKPAPPKAAPAK